MPNEGIVRQINGPVVKGHNMSSFKLNEMVTVGKQKLIGEVVEINDHIATVQVYEETEGLKAGELINGTGGPLSVTLGPGMLGNIFDGIQRPLKIIRDTSGNYIPDGIGMLSLDKEKQWEVKIKVSPGDLLEPGMVYATVQETASILHKLIVPENIRGIVSEVKADGYYTLNDSIVMLEIEGEQYEETADKDKDNKNRKEGWKGKEGRENREGKEGKQSKEGKEGKKENERNEENANNVRCLTLSHMWPVRRPRPVSTRIPIYKPLITGQRVIDSFYPVAKGGTVGLPGGFGTGKTVTQHQLAKWSDADIIVYIGCGERGNEMTDVLEEFPALTDPRTGRPLMERTILIANTSNMPVAAREACIYTGITMAEYYRDMGYDVAVMADSTSRWAEALREISGRLEEMPAEEGYPAYLPSRLAEFYERAGCVKTLNGQEASVTIIGAVSPPGGDFSEPVTENTKRFVSSFLALDRKLAYARHFPAINYLTSYSGYVNILKDWYTKNVAPDMLELRAKMISLLQEEEKINEIVQLVGEDVLPNDQVLILKIAGIIKNGFLQQSALHKEDSFVTLQKQYKMLKTIDTLYINSLECVKSDIPVSLIMSQDVISEVLKMKYEIPDDKPELFDALCEKINTAFKNLLLKYDFTTGLSADSIEDTATGSKAGTAAGDAAAAATATGSAVDAAKGDAKGTSASGEANAAKGDAKGTFASGEANAATGDANDTAASIAVDAAKGDAKGTSASREANAAKDPTTDTAASSHKKDELL